MSSNSSVRSQKTDSDRLQQILLDNEVSFINGLKPQNSESSGGLDASGGAAGDGGNQAPGLGNFLPTEGGTMIGPIAFFPRLVTIASDTIDVSKDGGNFAGKIILSPESGFTDSLSTIFGATHAGQKLTIQSIAGTTITINALGNIVPPGGSAFTLQSNVANGMLLELEFNATSNKWEFVDEAIWKDLFDRIGAGGGSPEDWHLHPALTNVDINLKSLIGVNAIEMKDSGNNNRGTFSADAAIGTQLSLPSGNSFRVSEVLTPILDVTPTRMEVFVNQDMNGNEIDNIDLLRFTDSRRFIQEDNTLPGIDLIVDDAEDFWIFQTNDTIAKFGDNIDFWKPVDFNNQVLLQIQTANFNGGLAISNSAFIKPTSSPFVFFFNSGLVFQFIEESGAKVLKMDSSARIDFNNSISSASSGFATLPANPAGFTIIRIGGADRKVPYYF